MLYFLPVAYRVGWRRVSLPHPHPEATLPGVWLALELEGPDSSPPSATNLLFSPRQVSSPFWASVYPFDNMSRACWRQLDGLGRADLAVPIVACGPGASGLTSLCVHM